MTSPRSYAAELTVAAAVAELQRAAGTQFDPAVVEAFSEMAAELVWPSDRPAVADQLDPSTTAADHPWAPQRRAC
jgi:HD-GYP domain-containing protein (c-di-GMP phosphodiesterase class II)